MESDDFWRCLLSPGPFRLRGWLNFHWMNECLNAHGFMDRVQSVTSFIAFSVQTRMRSSAVDFNHASSPVPGCWLSRIRRLLSQIWTLTTLTSYTVWMHMDIKLLLHTDGSWYVHKSRTEVATQYTYVQLYMCVFPKGVQMKSKPKHTGTWSAAVWPPRRLCYHPALFFLRLRLRASSFPLVKNMPQKFIRCFFFNLLIFK